MLSVPTVYSVESKHLHEGTDPSRDSNQIRLYGVTDIPTLLMSVVIGLFDMHISETVSVSIIRYEYKGGKNHTQLGLSEHPRQYPT